MELTKEAYEDFMKRLHFHNKGQGKDDHITAEPIFIVQRLNRVYGLDSEYSDKSIIVDTKDTESHWDDIVDLFASLDKEQISDILKKADCGSKDEFLETGDWEQYNHLENSGYERVFYVEQQEYVNSHFTKEAADAFIERKKHDYPLGLRVYVESQNYCWEWNMIVQGLLSGDIRMLETPPSLKFSDFGAYCGRKKGEFPIGLSVPIGMEFVHQNGQTGLLYSFDFGKNSIGILMGNGFYWEGTGQEFRDQWKEKED